MEQCCGAEAVGELNSKFKASECECEWRVSRGGRGCDADSTGSLDAVCAGVNGPWRVDSHSAHVFD